MQRKFPSADQPLNYEHVLFNHLECTSFFVAQGTADLKQMIEIYEQYVIPRTNRFERSLLRRFKLAMKELKELVNEYYDKMIKKAKNSDRPEMNIQEIEEDKDSVLEDLEGIYYKILLRLLVVLTKRRIEEGEQGYTEKEFWDDLLVELIGVVPFSSDVVKEVVNYYSEDENKVVGEDSAGDTGEATLDVE